jgi:hypothetical protein
VLLVAASPATAGWSSAGAGSGAASARSLPAGNTPSASSALGTVTVTWSASSFAGGGPVPSYVVRRFNALSGAEATVGAACSGLVSSTSCVETGVPAGQWKYSVTPAAGAWRGGQSAQGNTVTVLI